MTVDFNQSDVVLRIQYLADGKQVEFYIPFPIFSPNDVEVYTNAVLQTDTYDIPWPEQQGRFRAIFLSPPAAGSTIILRRCMEITRNSRFQESGRLSAKALNTEFDYVAAALQQVYAESARAIRLNPTDEEAALLLPVREERTNKALVFDSQGNTSVSAMPRQLSDISEDSHFKHFTAEQEAKRTGCGN
jgi:hypothetical protein